MRRAHCRWTRVPQSRTARFAVRRVERITSPRAVQRGGVLLRMCTDWQMISAKKQEREKAFIRRGLRLYGEGEKEGNAAPEIGDQTLNPKP
jgi:hypothetical protein